ncbi:MAG: CotH kinase family protein [Bacteroidota bacterium]
MKKHLFLLFVFILLMNWGGNAQIVINEYSCSNVSSYTDNFGNYEDWIELYNTSAVAVTMNGWYLSDKITTPLKWRITTATIAAHGYLRIWASGRDIGTGTLHANFKLTQCKPEDIILSNASGTAADVLTLKPTLEGHSRGRTTDGAGTWSVFLNPTPAAANTNPYSDYAGRPVMSVGHGFYTTAQTVSMSSITPGVAIRYTLDGTTPTAASTLYTAPINIATTKVLRAIAISSVGTTPNSFVESNTYFINEPHSVAVVSIYGDGVMDLMTGTQSEPYTGIEYFDENGVFKTESYGNTNKHGNDSWSYPQRGIDFISHDQYGYNYALLDTIFNSKTRAEFQHIIFKAAANDNYPFETPGSGYAWGPSDQLGAVHIRDSYVHTLSQKAKLHLDERTWAPSVLYVNGLYWGVYDTREKVDDADFIDYYHHTPEDSLQMLKTWGGTWSEYGGAQAQTDWNNLSNFITTNNMTIPANYAYVDTMLSLKSLADYVIINSFCVTSDWLNWNTQWWRGINVGADKRKWRYTLWDEDATFHHYVNYTGIPNTNVDADPCDPNSLGDPGGQGQVPVLNALMQNQTFYQYYIMRYFDLLNGPLSCNRMTTILDSMVNVIQPEMQQQITRWGAGGTYAAWWANYQTLRTFIQDRCQTVTQNFVDCWPVTGPFPIKVNVVPAGAGNIDINSLNLTNFVWSGQYPGNMNILMTAHPNGNYCFDHWEFQHHTPSPSINDSSISFLFTMHDSIVAHFTNGTNPTATASPSTICSGDSSNLLVSAGTTILWSPATGLSCTNCANPTANPTATTTYTVTVSGGCGTGTATVTVTVSPPGVTTPTLSATYPVLCIGDSTAIQVSPTATTYAWSPAATLSCNNCANPIATPTATTTYTVSVTGNCSSGTASITITIAPPPTVTTGENPTICPNSSIQLTASGATSYAWSPASGLSCSNCSNPIASPDATTIYTIIGSNGTGDGCKDTTSMIVYVTDVCPDLYIPTGFSPNGDYNNDVYYIYGQTTALDLVIYDRWGHVVFKTTDQTKGWDGTLNGKDLPSDVYGYKISVTDYKGNVISQVGNITLVR